MNLRNTIKNKEKNKKHFIWNNIQVFIKDPLTDSEISLNNVLHTIDQKIPKHLLTNLDAIYIGQFDFLNDRSIQAMYENSSIFVTNEQDSEEDMADDIAHEIAHSIEDVRGEAIYGDGELEEEFLLKRRQLYSVIKSENLPADLNSFTESDYKKEFDEYLYKEIGYQRLNMISANLFYSPYAVTSLKEYFANGFEAYFFYGEYAFLEKTCPKLFNKLSALLENDYDQNY